MKSLIAAVLLTVPLMGNATPTEEDYCAFIVPELRQAVKDGILDEQEATSILLRCYNLKRHEKTTYAIRSV